MLVEGRMNLPVEVVEQGRDRPFELIFTKLARVSRHAGLHGKRVFAEAVRFGVLAENLPGFVPTEHGPSYTAVAPRRLARGAEALAVALQDTLGTQPFGGAGFEHDESRLMDGAADDAGGSERNGLARQGDVTELLVLIAQLAFLNAAMQ